jgi:hypothetical protein
MIAEGCGNPHFAAALAGVEQRLTGELQVKRQPSPLEYWASLSERIRGPMPNGENSGRRSIEANGSGPQN